MTDFTEGIAFIMEGKTEKVFYKCFLEYICKSNPEIEFCKESLEDGEVFFVWKNSEKKIMIKFYVVGTISQITNSGSWFANKCANKVKIPWSVYLCYDTDSSDNEISKFYEGDWSRLRIQLEKAHAEKISDLAASADIEDIMLCDLEGVCRYLSIPVPENVSGRKGKAKMKMLHRSCGATYHEAEKALPLIESLDFSKIMEKQVVDLQGLRNHLLK